MSKRRALTQLTRDDLDREDSPERDEPSSNSFETGIQVAPAETLEKRVIRKARRSLVSDHTGDDNVKTSPFVGLSLAASKPVDSPFAAFSSSAFKVTPSGLKSNLPVPKPSAEKASVNLPPQNGKSNGVEGIEPEDMERDPAYYKKLTNLNKTFKKWVLDFMEKGPYYDFTPVCRDYMSFISKLDEQFPILAANKSKQTVAQTVPPPVVQAVTAAPLLTSKPPSEAPSTPKFTFGASAGLGGAFGSQKSSTPTLFPMTMGTSSQPAIGTGPSFSFGQSGSSQPTFGSAFGTPVAAPAAVQSVNGEDDENYEPPQPETVKVEEKDAIFSKESCKLYIKEKDKFELKGTGTMHIKKVDSGKHQLIFRADNALGTIWLNILLSQGIPVVSKKNNLMITCVPNPPPTSAASDNTSTVTYLMKCSTEAEALDILSRINELKS